MKVRIEFVDGRIKEYDWCSDAGVQDGVLWVRPSGPGSDLVDRYPLVNIRTWSTDRG